MRYLWGFLSGLFAVLSVQPANTSGEFFALAAMSAISAGIAVFGPDLPPTCKG